MPRSKGPAWHPPEDERLAPNPATATDRRGWATAIRLLQPAPRRAPQPVSGMLEEGAVPRFCIDGCVQTWHLLEEIKTFKGASCGPTGLSDRLLWGDEFGAASVSDGSEGGCGIRRAAL